MSPYALEVPGKNYLPTGGLRSKSWDEFAQPEAPQLDFVFIVCDSAAGKVCPAWRGQSMTTHWGIPDLAVIEGDEYAKRKAFPEASRTLMNRFRVFTRLPRDKPDRLSLQRRLDDLKKSLANVTTN